MGADGAIDIYDYEILCASLGRKLDHGDFEGYHTYIHEIFGKKVVTDYYGDNMWANYCIVCKKERCDGELPAWDSPRPLEKAHLALLKPARITTWEVWT